MSKYLKEVRGETYRNVGKEVFKEGKTSAKPERRTERHVWGAVGATDREAVQEVRKVKEWGRSFIRAGSTDRLTWRDQFNSVLNDI